MRRRGFLGAILGALGASVARAEPMGLDHPAPVDIGPAVERGVDGLTKKYRDEFIAGFEGRAALLKAVRSDVSIYPGSIYPGSITWVDGESDLEDIVFEPTIFPKELLP